MPRLVTIAHDLLCCRCGMCGAWTYAATLCTWCRRG